MATRLTTPRNPLELERRFFAALRTGDVHRLARLFVSDGKAWVPWFGAAHGHDLPYAMELLADEAHGESLTLQSSVQVNFGLDVLVIAEWVLRSTAPELEGLVLRGHSRDVARLQGDGGWLFAVEDLYADWWLE